MTEDSEILAAFEGQFTDSAPAEEIDYSALDNMHLAARYSAVRAELYKRQEMHDANPATERGRKLHSQLAAILVVMSERGLR